MNVNQVVRTITIKGVSDGVEKLTGDVNKLAAAQENVAVVSETSARRVLSLEDAWKKQTLKLDEAARAQANIARESKIADGALREGLITQQQHAERLNMISQRYAVATVQAGKFAQQTGLNRYEILNFSRQIQDVGVSLAGGQNPFVVLAQQGSQIADVFQASNGSVRGFFTQSIGWAGRFVTSAAGVTAGIVGIGAAALYMGSSFASAQKDIDRALSGAGAASGLNRGGINRIADRASSPTGLSISEAREAATAFAATGKIYGDNVERATLLTKDFARAMGIDASEATKRLAKDLQDPVAAAMEWNKTLGFLDAKTLDHIRSLVAMGRRQEAVNALMAAAAPSLGKMAQNVDIVTRAYDALGNAISDTFEKWKAFAARSLEKTTGANLGAFSDEDRLTLLRQRRDERSRGPFAQGLDAGPIRALNKEIAELEMKLHGAAAAASEVRFGQLSLQANEFTRSLIPSIEQVEKLTQAISTLEQYQAGRSSRGLGADPQAESALAVARMQLAIAMEQEGVETRKAQIFAQNALAHQNVSATTAQQLATMRDQLSVAQAVTGAAEIEAQHRATINSLLAQGKTLTDAIAIADAQRAISLAQVNAEADRMLRNLQQQGQLLQASSQYEKDRIAAAQTYRDLIEKNVDSEKARAIASQQLRNADLTREAQETAEAERDAARSAERHAQANQAAAVAAERTAQAAAEAQRRWDAAAQALKFVPFYLLDALGLMDQLFNSKQGGKSQFDPAGYEFKTDVAAGSLFGTGGDINAQIDKVLAGGGSGLDAFSSLLGGGLTKTQKMTGGLNNSIGSSSSASLDTEKLSALERLIATMSPENKTSATQSLLQSLNAMTPSLERNEAINRLTDSLKQLTDATEQNTSATRAITDVLSPLYSSDPRRTHLGFRAFAGGGIMTPWGEMPLRKYDGGGIATSPQISVFGEGSTPEAYVPVPSGRIPVEMRMPANSNNNQQRPIQQTIIIQGNATPETVDALKRTAYQQAQAMRRALG